jgi:hypothetical protein
VATMGTAVATMGTAVATMGTAVPCEVSAVATTATAVPREVSAVATTATAVPSEVSAVPRGVTDAQGLRAQRTPTDPSRFPGGYEVRYEASRAEATRSKLPPRATGDPSGATLLQSAQGVT